MMYATYEEASLIPPTDEGKGEYASLHSWPNRVKNLLPMAYAVLKLLVIVSCPAALLLQLALLAVFSWRADLLLCTLAVFFYQFVFVRWTRRIHAQKGLYYKHALTGAKHNAIEILLSRCPKLTSSCALDAGLPGLPATAWMLGGDLRTLAPFLLNSQPSYSYTRMYCRVPVADGPRRAMKQVDSMGNKYDAVAVDKTSETNLTKASSTALLILAGLTGGSQEGYVLDLVNAASQANIRCFVMLGRGVGAGNPNRSDAGFHGARTSDLATVAMVIKGSLPPHQSLVVVGISMGGIIAINAAARGEITEESVSAVISVSGCFDTAKNVAYLNSRRVWQPILTFGLKENFCHPAAVERMAKRMGPNVVAKVTNCCDVLDFDKVVVTETHNFKNVWEYYKDMSGARQPLDFSVPVLVVHAADDPIIHADTNQPERMGTLSENLVILLTETGGHVGFPLGTCPWRHKFLFQNELILEFAAAASNNTD